MTTVALALATSLLFGVGDFLGGIATRRDSAFAVTGTSHLLSIGLLGMAVLLLPAAAPSAGDLWWGAVSGLTGVIGVMALYAGLAVGRMSIVAPVTAALSAAIPALWDLASGTRLSTISLAGIALALVAIVVTSIAPDDTRPSESYQPRRALAFSLVSGVGFASAFIAFSFTAPESGLTPVLSARVVSIAVAVTLALLVARSFPVDRPALPATLGAGLTDALANVTMLTAIRIGPLAIASVLGSLFPVVVVVLARVFLGERLTALQRVGVALAIVAVAMTAVP